MFPFLTQRNIRHPRVVRERYLCKQNLVTLLSVEDNQTFEDDVSTILLVAKRLKEGVVSEGTRGRKRGSLSEN